MIKILAVVLTALAMMFGPHLVLVMFEAGVAATLVTGFAVAGKVLETGWRCVPRPVRFA